MQFTSTITLLTALSLASRSGSTPIPSEAYTVSSPTPCSANSTIPATPFSPPPSAFRCGIAGQAHFDAGVIIADRSQHGWIAGNCAQSCLEDSECKGLAFDEERQRCLTFRSSPGQMGFRRAEGAVFKYWNPACWTAAQC